MKIAGTNYSVLSLKASNSLLNTQKAIARSLERLASGQRVSSPRDDAHAYVQGVGLTAQIRGLTQANFGLNTGLGMVATAESAVSTQINIVQRMRELAVQAANGSLTNLQRSMLNEEVQTLLEEYNRITAQTDFNGRKLLDGSFTTINLQAGTNKGNSIGFTIGSTQASSVFVQRTTVGDGTFSVASTNSLGSNAINLAASDLNGDGNQDLISIDLLDATLSILLGNGDGTFQTRTTISTGTHPTSAIAIDVNADGLLDLMSADYTGATVSISLGNGDGTFQARTTLDAGAGPRILTSIDANGDGRVDLLATSPIQGTVSLFLGNGDGTFQTRTTLAAGATPQVMSVEDVNGDGKMDIIAADSTNTTISTFLSNGNGTFQAKIDTLVSYSDTFATGDANGDGYLDILIPNADIGNVTMLLGNGNGTFQAESVITSDSWISFAALAFDVNGDGHLDLFTGSEDTAVGFYLGNGNGTFKTRAQIPTGDYTMSLIAADLNGDGVSDILTRDDSGTSTSILSNTTTASAVAAVSIATQEDAEAMLQVFDDAMAALSETQANLGSIHSRLNVAVANNLILSDNLVEARSRALDTDYATEVADLVQNQILQDAGLAVLAQANLNQQLVLRILNGMKS